MAKGKVLRMKNLNSIVRGFTVLISVIILLGLVACGDEGDTTSPALSLDQDPEAILSPVFVPQVELGGAVEPGATLELSLNSGDEEAVENINGVWSVVVEGLVPGSNTISITATDDRGNNRTLILAVVYQVIAIDHFVTPTPDDQQVIGGTLGEGVPLPVVESDTTAVVSGLSVNGTVWTGTVSGLVEGSYTLTAKVTVNGEEQTSAVVINVDITAPLLTIDPLGQTTSAQEVDLSGTVAGNVASLDVVVNGEDPIAVTPSVGQWQVTVAGLKVGKNLVTVTATDDQAKVAVGNTAIWREL